MCLRVCRAHVHERAVQRSDAAGGASRRGPGHGLRVRRVRIRALAPQLIRVFGGLPTVGGE
jgi:hypothetical protein